MPEDLQSMTPEWFTQVLSGDQMLPILQRATGDADLPDFQLLSVRELPPERLGYCANVHIPTFSGLTSDGLPWRITLFAKRMHWVAFREAHHFERLGRMGLPVTRFYGCVPAPSGKEILFLEYLSHTGIDGTNAAHRGRHLALHARINALGVPAEYTEEMSAVHSDRLIEEWTVAIQEIHSCGRAHQLGEGMAEFCRTHKPDELLALVRETAEEVAQIPLALNHGEPGFQNYGWRNDELVFFDLHKFGPAPRFRDIADVILDLKTVHSPPMTWDQAVELYLEEYHHAGGRVVDRRCFLKEIDCLYRYNSYRLLSWLKGMALDGESFVDKGRDVHRARLLNFLGRILY